MKRQSFVFFFILYYGWQVVGPLLCPHFRIFFQMKLDSFRPLGGKSIYQGALTRWFCERSNACGPAIQTNFSQRVCGQADKKFADPAIPCITISRTQALSALEQPEACRFWSWTGILMEFYLPCEFAGYEILGSLLGSFCECERPASRDPFEYQIISLYAQAQNCVTVASFLN